MGDKEVRESNFELLRIIAMVFIILSHISVHGDWGEDIFLPDGLSLNVMFLQALLPLGKLGVNLFVLISGYFLVNYTKSTWSKILGLWFEMIFYSLLITAAFAFSGDWDYSPSALFWTFTPAIHGIWWFASCYLIMLGLSPFINKMLDRCSEREHLKLLIGLFALWAVLPTITGVHMMFNETIWFLVMYVTGAYIAKYPGHFNSPSSRYCIYAMCFYAANLVFIYTVDITGFSSDFLWIHDYVDRATGMTWMPMVASALFIFLAFRNLDIGRRRLINTVASTIFGIYLIHDHPLVRDYIYDNFFDCAAWIDSELLIPYVILICLVIFTVCLVEELLRSETIGKYLFNPISSRSSILQNRFDEFIDDHIKSPEDV